MIPQLSLFVYQDNSGQIWVAWADVYMLIKRSLPEDTDGFIAFYDLPEADRTTMTVPTLPVPDLPMITMKCAFRLLWTALDGAS
jgi:hypothetical protein